MIKTMAASSAAKAAALCICPVVGAGVAVTQVPQARKLVHKATAPKAPIRKARALPRGVEVPCVPTTTVASAVPSVVPRVAQVLPQAALPTPELETLPTTAQTAASAGPVGSVGGPSGGIFGGPFNPGGGIGGGGGGGGVGGFIPIVTPGPETPVLPNPGGGVVAPIPEPAAWVQMTGGFMVVGATVRYARRAKVGKPA